MSHCYIAFVEEFGHAEHVTVKIGHTKNLTARFRQLSAEGWISPFCIEATALTPDHHGREIETFMHDRLARFRIHHEWFHVPITALDEAKGAVAVSYGVQFDFYDLSDIDPRQAIRDLLPIASVHYAGRA